MTTSTVEGALLRPVPADARSGCRLGHFLDRVERERGLTFADYDAAWRWSVTDLAGFWGAVWDYFEIRAHTPYREVLADAAMPGARWFTGATLNYAEHMLGRLDSPQTDAGRTALLARSQTRGPIELTLGELRDQVARARAGLQRLGVGQGDRVVAYLPNIPETLVAFLATASLGAVWASCATEFGPRSVVDRFAQIQPTVLLAVPGYVYGAKPVDRRAEVAEVLAGLPTVRHLVEVPYGELRLDAPAGGPSSAASSSAASSSAGLVGWGELLAEPGELAFEPVPFDHPLYVLFSSGTTGIPKAIVHRHGGILVEHYKNHAFSWDLGPGDTMFWFTTTAWMMWNALVSTLLVGAVPVLLDGNPLHPDLAETWRLVEETGATVVGTSPGYVMACRKAGIRPAEQFGLSRVRQLAVAGSPLAPEGAAWLVEQLGPDVLLNVGSGGTDVCTGMVQGSPLQPVWAGEMSGRCLGVAADAVHPDTHRPVVGELGEMVITAPMPSMPVGFWGDDDGRRYREAYFDAIPGMWRQGDWIRFTERGSCVITGRSDATLNRGGVRLGTADFYTVVEELPEVVDSLVVHLEDREGGPGELLLFVVPAAGTHLDDDLRRRVVTALRSSLSPRHVPDDVVEVPAIPRSRTGKKLELPVKKILLGEAVEQVASRDALVDPDSLAPYVELSRLRRAGAPG